MRETTRERRRARRPSTPGDLLEPVLGFLLEAASVTRACVTGTCCVQLCDSTRIQLVVSPGKARRAASSGDSLSFSDSSKMCYAFSMQLLCSHCQ